MDNLTELTRVMSQKMLVPTLGYRAVKTLPDGRVFDAANQDISHYFQSLDKPKEVFKEDGQRMDLSTLAERQLQISTTNSSILKSTNALKSFQEMKENLLTDLDLENDTLEELNQIEQYLVSFVERYVQKKEMLRDTYRLNLLK